MSEATRSVISSPGSADGPTRSGSPDGQTTNPSGPAPVRVSRFRARDSEKAMPTNDTSGPLFTASSISAALQRSLENRLLEKTDLNGSPEFVLISKVIDMPSGLPIFAVRGRARRTSDSAFIGWPTLRANDGEKRGNVADDPRNGLVNLHCLRHWQTPKASDGTFDTPRTSGRPIEKSTHLQTQAVATLRSWATPKARDHKGNGVSIARAAKGISDSLDLQVKLISRSGTAQPSPLSARMDGGAFRLNPMHSLWLMGYPPEWESCAGPATRSTRKSRQSS